MTRIINLTPEEHRVEVERVARLICQAMHANVSPDATVCRGAPSRLAPCGMQVIWPGDLVPLWVTYMDAARAVHEDEKRREALEYAEQFRRAGGLRGAVNDGESVI